MSLTGIPLPDDMERKTTEAPRLDEYVKSLLTDRHIAELPIQDQGRVIVDQFIGGLLRQGELTSSQNQSFNAADILYLMDNLNGDEDLKKFTSSAGLRKAVEELSTDPRSATVFGSLGSRLESTLVSTQEGEKELFTLTSLAQIEGYLKAGGAKNRKLNPTGGVHMEGDSWIPVLVDGISRMSQDETRTWMTRSDAYGFIESSAPLIKNTGRDWVKATTTAESVGVDMALVQRSAEKVQARMSSGRHLAEMAFSKLMIGRVENYNVDLRRRSY